MTIVIWSYNYVYYILYACTHMYTQTRGEPVTQADSWAPAPEILTPGVSGRAWNSAFEQHLAVQMQ